MQPGILLTALATLIGTFSAIAQTGTAGGQPAAVAPAQPAPPPPAITAPPPPITAPPPFTRPAPPITTPPPATTPPAFQPAIPPGRLTPQTVTNFPFGRVPVTNTLGRITAAHPFTTNRFGVVTRTNFGFAVQTNAPPFASQATNALMLAGTNLPLNAITPQQRQNINRLIADMAALRGSQLTPQFRQQLQNDLLAGTQAGGQPSEGAIVRLANDLSLGLGSVNLAAPTQLRLARNLNLLMNAAALNQGQVDVLLSDTQGALQTAGLATLDLQQILVDLATVAAELQQGVGGAQMREQSSGTAR